ncbi:MAG TPA: hypothetical protein VFC46_09000 [Humisphaera sp.]|nr:hypothetical protein [Humisphaera sp.]
MPDSTNKPPAANSDHSMTDLEAAELSETLAGIRRGLEQAHRGEGRIMREFLQELADKHGFSLE